MTKPRAIASAALCVLGLAVAPLPVSAAHDTKPPVLTTPVKVSFVTGSQLHQFRDAEEGHAYFDVPLHFGWSATDNVDTETFQNLHRLRGLRIEHRDLDDVIHRLQFDLYVDQVQLRRLKKRKLLLKDQIARLESQLIPDLNA